MVLVQCYQQWIMKGKDNHHGRSGGPMNINDRENRLVATAVTPAPTALILLNRHLQPLFRLHVVLEETIRRRLADSEFRTALHNNTNSNSLPNSITLATIFSRTRRTPIPYPVTKSFATRARLECIWKATAFLKYR
ncbi:hypothetical protein NPIL_488641 [Nephila pilipes]|uniref:Uncharacterized protein n=1 Tax=Nephila pilipes TaxID=299642 RepID=A0A8X6NT90_NEPPI|nr:hypothetical protein NPIL_488641 [Nephila pilipes]